VSNIFFELCLFPRLIGSEFKSNVWVLEVPRELTEVFRSLLSDATTYLVADVIDVGRNQGMPNVIVIVSGKLSTF
jgi:hypothetical protein